MFDYEDDDELRGRLEAGLADEAAGSGVGLGFFGSLFPPADFAMEIEPAADRFCFFEGLDVVWNPSQDDTFAADNGNVVMDGWLGYQVGWIHPAGTQTAPIFPTNTGFERGLLVARNPLDELAVNVEQRDVVARLFPYRWSGREG